MRIGCPKEIKTREDRVGLTPTAAREAVAHGHAVLVEAGAVSASGRHHELLRSHPAYRDVVLRGGE